MQSAAFGNVQSLYCNSGVYLLSKHYFNSQLCVVGNRTRT